MEISLDKFRKKLSEYYINGYEMAYRDLIGFLKNRMKKEEFAIYFNELEKRYHDNPFSIGHLDNFFSELKKACK